MMRNISLISAAFYFLATGAIALYSSSGSAFSATTASETASAGLSVKEQQSLIYLLKQDCGSCHGLTLQGGLGPALLKKNLKGKPAEYLESVIAYGRAGTPMPPWKDILNKQQIKFLASYLLSDLNTLANQSKELKSKDKSSEVANSKNISKMEQ